MPNCNEADVSEVSQLLNQMTAMGIQPNTVIYTTVISSLMKAGRGDKALSTFNQMVENGCTSFTVTSNLLLKWLAKEAKAEEAVELLEKMMAVGCELDTVTCNSVVHGLSMAGRGNLALCSLTRTLQSGSTFITLIHSLTAEGKTEEAVELVDKTIAMVYELNKVICTNLTFGLSKAGRGTMVTSMMSQSGCYPDAVDLSTLIPYLAKESKPEKAVQLLDKVIAIGCEPNAETYKFLIDRLSKLRPCDIALTGMPKSGCCPRTVTSTGSIQSLAEERKTEAALKLLEGMAANGSQPNTITYTSLIDSKTGKADAAQSISSFILEGKYCPNTETFNALIRRFTLEGKTEAAVELVEKMTAMGNEPNIMTFHSLIYGLSKTGQDDMTFSMLSRLLQIGRCPDTMTFNVLIQRLAKEGQTEDAVELLEKMRVMGLKPDSTTYNSLIRGLSKSGRVDMALSILTQMLKTRCCPDSVTFNSLIYGLANKAKQKLWNCWRND